MNAAQAPPAAPRLGRTLWLTVATTLVGAAVVGGVYVAALSQGAGFEDFSRNPAQRLDGEFYPVWLHYQGIVVWTVAATTAIFGSCLLRRAGRKDGSRFLLVGGGLTAAMGLGDAFILHDHVYTALGVPKDAVFVTYAIAVAAYAGWFRRRLGVDLLLMAGAYGFWGLSVLLDVLLPLDSPLFLVEDGAKAIGLALWTVLLVKKTLAELDPVLDTGSRSSARASARHRRRGGAAGRSPETGPVHLGDLSSRTEPIPRIVLPGPHPVGTGATRWRPGPADRRRVAASSYDVPRSAPPPGGVPAEGPLNGSFGRGRNGWSSGELAYPGRNGASANNGSGGHNGYGGQTGYVSRHGSGAGNGHGGSNGYGVSNGTGWGNGYSGSNGYSGRNGSSNGRRRYDDQDG